MKNADHNARTADYFRKLGFLYERTEWNVTLGDGRQIKRDLFGVFDGLAVRAGRLGLELVGVQITSESNLSTHFKKLCDPEPMAGRFAGRSRLYNTRAWMSAGGSIVIITWKKVGARWVPTEHWIRPDDVDAKAEGKRVSLKGMVRCLQQDAQPALL